MIGPHASGKQRAGTAAAPVSARSLAAATEVPDLSGNAIVEFRKRLAVWYRKHARVLPWRGIQDPYAIWLSEIMLQQTQVATVQYRYIEFLRRFPTLQAL